MKMFTKIALVSAMAISTGAMAAQMQSLDDEALSATTGQDGITLTINTSGITIDKLLIHDNDGLETIANGGFVNINQANTAALTAAQNAVTTAQSDYDAALLAASGNTADPAVVAAQTVLTNAQTALAGTPATVLAPQDLGGTETAGAIVLNQVGLNITGATTIKLDTDAGDDGAGGTAPFLNIGVNTGAVNLTVDNISVGASGTVPGSTGANRRGATNEVTILSGYTAANKIDITLGQTALNIQLGHTPQGAMILASGTVSNGIEIKNLAINDASGGGAIGLDRIRITDANSGDLSANAKISATVNGLLIDTGTTIDKDIYIEGVRFGALANMDASAATRNASIGDVEIQGLNMGTSSILVSGH